MQDSFPTYEQTAELCKEMLYQYDHRSGAFSGCTYATQSEIFDELPDKAISDYFNSEEVQSEIDRERLRLCVWHFEQKHWSETYEQIRAAMNSKLVGLGYERPPFQFIENPVRNIAEVAKLAARKITERGGFRVETTTINGDRTIDFLVNGKYLGTMWCSIKIRHRHDGFVKFSASGGGLQPCGYYVALEQDHISGLDHCKQWRYDPSPKFSHYLTPSNYKEELENIINILFAEISFF